MAIKKSTINEKARKALESILYDEILNSDKIDQVKIIKRLAILEKQIYASLEAGNKEYYKPLQIKSKSNYDDPMGQQGIKASVIWNMVRDEDLPAIDLDARNRIDVVKVSITRDNLNRIEESYPQTYGNLLEAFEYLEKSELKRAQDRDIAKGKEPRTTIPDVEITALAIPTDTETPKWVLEFIDYQTIINDCLCNFPIASVGISNMDNDNVNYSNIVSI